MYHLWYTACGRMEASQENEVLCNGKSGADFIQGLPDKVCHRDRLPEIYVRGAIPKWVRMPQMRMP